MREEAAGGLNILFHLLVPAASKVRSEIHGGGGMECCSLIDAREDIEDEDSEDFEGEPASVDQFLERLAGLLKH